MKRYTPTGIDSGEMMREEPEWGEWVRWEDAYSWGSKKVESLIAERDSLSVQVKKLQADVRTLEAIRDVWRLTERLRSDSS